MSRAVFFPADEFRRCLIGTLENACFLKQGAERFTNSVEEAMRSFWLLLLSVPLNFSAVLFLSQHSEKLKSAPALALIEQEATRLVFVNLFFILAVYVLCKIHQRLENFPRYLAGMNWLQLIPILFETPIHLMVWSGLHTLDEVTMLEAFFMVYILFVTGYFIMNSLKIRAPMAVFLVFMMFIVEDMTRHALLY
ncbi:MAG: hypothetical protein KA099_04740 [Alphaproteobacteria bacterium]|nr:hypothetical protein [Alphaproteobacteria bacterium]MBP7759619.1 hypothetical protein [Alphaproteobacteria bacterium]MBP7763158.1 hypothetical protein [Alphaproteobacteria bacterium]MBP7904617.1 hypothetical protein [Alphaproteobacteria bacterium]